MAQWVRRRQGTDRLPVTLERRRLYILPTRAGLAFAKRVALVVGNDRYPNLPAHEQLQKAVNDAQAVSGALKSPEGPA